MQIWPDCIPCILKMALEVMRTLKKNKKEDLQRPIRFSSDIGTYRPPYFGMLGHTLMAYLNDEEVDRIIEENPLQPFEWAYEKGVLYILQARRAKTGVD